MVDLEVKLKLPAKSLGDSSERAAKQLQAGIAGKDLTVLVGVQPSGLKTDKRAKDFLAAISGVKALQKLSMVFRGVPSMLKDYLIEECIMD